MGMTGVDLSRGKMNIFQAVVEFARIQNRANAEFCEASSGRASLEGFAPKIKCRRRLQRRLLV
jgi:hypothetical protein